MDSSNFICSAKAVFKSFKKKCSTAYHKVSAKYEILNNYPLFNSSPYLIKIATNLPNLIFKSDSNKDSPKTPSNPYISKAVDISKEIGAFYGGYCLFKLVGKTNSCIKKLKSDNKSENPLKQKKAKLEAVALTGEYFASLEAVNKFLEACGVQIVKISAVVGHIFKGLGLFLSIANLIKSGIEHHETRKFTKNLKTVRYLAFLKAYDKNAYRKSWENLSTTELKSKIRPIRRNLKFNDQKKLNRISYIANRAFIEKLNYKITNDESLIEGHFGIKFKEQKDNFFDHLYSDFVRKDPKRTAAATRQLKRRLKMRSRSQKFTLLTNSLANATGFLGIAIAFGATNPVLATIEAGLIVFGCAGAAANIFKEHRNKKKFMANMSMIAVPSP